MNNKFIPLLFAGDINVYSVARAFHEEYDIKSVAYGKFNSGPCYKSKIIDYRSNLKADVQSVFLEIVMAFAQENSDKKIILIGCGDSYVQLISENRNVFPENIIAPYIDISLMNDLINKEKFYQLCEKAGIEYPKTFVHRESLGRAFDLPFNPPYIIKPSNGIEYWRNPFINQKKVYKTDTKEELEAVIIEIYKSGYKDSIIIQDFIPGDDTFMRVLTNYSDKNGKVKLMSLGHVLLEEHTPHGIGNHAVIITENNEEIENKYKKLLEEMNYIGFSNFDIKYDQRDGKYKVFEINTRQGRSNYYVTGAGANIAKYLVNDYIENIEIEEMTVVNRNLWMVVPKNVALKYINPTEYKKDIKDLIRSGKFVNPLFYKGDRGIIRRLRLEKSMIGHYFKYKKYLDK
jgi:D-aspartate ligase